MRVPLTSDIVQIMKRGNINVFILAQAIFDGDLATQNTITMNPTISAIVPKIT